jgi:dTDP-4-dehydrorhamnose 3,5-epimerase
VFLALEDDSVVSYLCSEPFNPSAEQGINPLDQDVAIPFSSKSISASFEISPKDSEAPTLNQAQEQGILPIFQR